MSKTFIEILKSEDIEKFNPYHDRLGRFTFADGFMVSNYSGDKDKQAVTFSADPNKKVGRMAIEREGMEGGHKVIPRAYGNELNNPLPQPPKKETSEPPKDPEKPQLKQGLKTGLGEQHAQNMENIVQKAPKEIQDVWNKYGDEIIVKNSAYRGTANCDFNGKISVNIEHDAKSGKFKPPYETTFHESGHSIDRAISRKTGNKFSVDYKNGLFEKTIKNEVDSYVKATAKRLEADPSYRANHPYAFSKNGKIRIGSVRSYIGDELRKGGAKATGDVSDMFEGATKGQISGSAGHGKSYWAGSSVYGMKLPGRSVAVEAFAEMFSATTTNPDSLATIKRYLPESYKVFTGMLNDAATF